MITRYLLFYQLHKTLVLALEELFVKVDQGSQIQNCSEDQMR